jgi:hypothetical protein
MCKHRVFRLQKKIIWIISSVGTKSPCRGLFRKFYILPVVCQYILSLMLFLVENQNNFQTNLNIHGITTRKKINFTSLVQVFLAFKRGFFTWVLGLLIVSQTILGILGMIRYNSKRSCNNILLLTLFIQLPNS